MHITQWFTFMHLRIENNTFLSSAKVHSQNVCVLPFNRVSSFDYFSSILIINWRYLSCNIFFIIEKDIFPEKFTDFIHWYFMSSGQSLNFTPSMLNNWQILKNNNFDRRMYYKFIMMLGQMILDQPKKKIPATSCNRHFLNRCSGIF